VGGDPRFAGYQECQSKPQVADAFRSAQHLAAFVVEPVSKQTLFVGVWDRIGEREAPPFDPFGSPRRSTSVAFETRLRPEFDVYRGRVVIEWGDGTRAWVQ